MKRIAYAVVVACIQLASSVAAHGQVHVPDLQSVPEANGWNGATSAFSVVNQDGNASLQCDRPGQHVIWLKDMELEGGTIEFDAKGRSQPQSSFIGVAFRVRDGRLFDAVYFRPFNFRPDAADRRARAIQYISEPAWPWEKLRAERTGEFEAAAVPAPDGDAWFHAKVVLENRRVRVWVDNAPAPSLQADELSDRKGGAVGVICIGHGAIANLRITPAPGAGAPKARVATP